MARTDDARRLGRRERPHLADAPRRMKPRDRAPDSQPRAPRPLPWSLLLRRLRGIPRPLRRCLLPRPLPQQLGRRGRDEVGVDARWPRALPQLHRPLPRAHSRWSEKRDDFAHAEVGARRSGLRVYM
jgi:hypothetical protein